jgi:hypothetical protein
MRKRLASAVISLGLLAGPMVPAASAHYYRSHAQYVRHKRHMATARRVGIGAAAGAGAGALLGGGKGAGIGALAGAGAGALWDRHEKHHGHY